MQVLASFIDYFMSWSPHFKSEYLHRLALERKSNSHVKALWGVQLM